METSTNLHLINNSINTMDSSSPKNGSNGTTVPPGCVVLTFGDFIPWDNPDNLIDHKTEEMFDMIVAVVFLNVCYCISAPTNILNMVVFAKQGLKERINLCLFFQSLADFVCMTFSFLLYADRVYLEITGGARRGPLFAFILNNHLVGLYGFNFASGFMTTMIACERCLCVVSPLKSQAMLKARTTLIIILVAFICIVGCFFFVGMRWSVKCVYNPRTDSTSPEIYPSDFYLTNRKLVDTLDGYVYGIALPGSFIAIVSIATVICVVKLRRNTLWRQSTATSARGGAAINHREVTLTRMLIGCSVLFVVCTFPSVVFRILILFVREISLNGRYYNTFVFMVSLTELCSYINSSFNFFIYYTLGTKFKETVQGLCCNRKYALKRDPTVSVILSQSQ